MNEFSQWSSLHLICLLACLVAVIATIVAGIKLRKRPTWEKRVRYGLAFGCLFFWVVSNGYGFFGGRLDWSESLPLHFCNLANLLGAHALMTRHRVSQGLMYFWTMALCSWAFLTPSLYVGPAHLWFWLFWLYHLFIPVATAWILVSDRFHPGWKDCRIAVLLTLAYMTAMAALDAFTGWNYAFVGATKPTQANLLDFLGPYPLRLLWMALIGATLFVLLTLPWLGSSPRPSRPTP